MNYTFKINNYTIQGIRRGDYAVGAKILRTDDSNRSKNGTAHMKTLAWKKVVTLNLKNITSIESKAIYDAIYNSENNINLTYFDYTRNADVTENFYVTDFDFTDAGIRNNTKYCETKLEFIMN